MDVAEARMWVERYTASDKPPGLDEEEIDMLLGIALDDRPWQADTRYLPGAAIVVGNSRWVSTLGGVSGLAEPTWTGTVSDGSATWTVQGDPAWNLHRAAAEGWRLIAGKIAHGFDFAMEGGSWSRSQAFAQALKMAALHDGKASGGGAGTLRSILIEPSGPHYRLAEAGLVRVE